MPPPFGNEERVTGVELDVVSALIEPGAARGEKKRRNIAMPVLVSLVFSVEEAVYGYIVVVVVVFWFIAFFVVVVVIVFVCVRI